MKDFFAIFIMLTLVMVGVLLFIFLAETIGVVGMAILEIIIGAAIILLAIRFIRPHG